MATHPRLGLTLLTLLTCAAPLRAQANEDEYRRVVAMGLAALESRRLDEGIAAFKRCLEIKANDQLCAYNLACAYSLKRDVRTALDWLSRSIEWGYDDLEHMQKDTDLDGVRDEPRYRALLARLRDQDPEPISDDATALQRTTELIVMLDGQMDGGPVIGAGIIFGRAGENIYIATAAHTVRRGSVAATDLQIKLRSTPDQPLPAKVTEHFDRALDVAVLVATLPAGHATPSCSMTPFDVLADSADVKRGDPVFPVGYPNGAPWAMPVEPDRIAQLIGNDISFQSAFISGGHSGGGVLTEQGRLIGMIKADKQPFGVAVRITRVIQAMRAWGYPVHLRTASNFLKTAMHAALEKGDLAAVRDLAAVCADVNTYDDAGRTPLHLAASLGHVDAVRLLLDAGADVSARTRGEPDSADIHSFTALHLAARSGSAAVAELLIARGAQVDAKAFDFMNRDWGGTPLHYAAAAGAVGVIEALLRAGADINAPSNHGFPITAAAHRRQVAATRLLMARGAHMKEGMTADPPLYVAATDGSEDIVKALLDGGADPNAGGAFGAPLHRAAEHGHIAIARMLIAKGANVNARSRFGQTALHEAAGAGRLELVKLLLAAGAQPNEKNSRGETPLHLAQSGNHTQIVALLRGR